MWYPSEVELAEEVQPIPLPPDMVQETSHR